ncbi:hypothetical protein MAR_015850 [Mya arenaria]|uniref:Tyr recombinase domain-containing protein n=1 Tax=Mya arenaria TaxID=6604 RepID=A0ABY7FMB2_MYAAR|nr:hypothetical protein MAR_015850 [Mya arenaria]
MEIFIKSSKTDQYRDGAWIVIARTGTLLCPVKNLEKYIQWAGFSGFKVRSVNKPMSYSTLRDLFIKTFKPLVTDVRKYGFHSLRSGGATAAANKGVKDRMFKRHGRWASEKAKDGYVKDS